MKCFKHIFIYSDSESKTTFHVIETGNFTEKMFRRHI